MPPYPGPLLSAPARESENKAKAEAESKPQVLTDEGASGEHRAYY